MSDLYTIAVLSCLAMVLAWLIQLRTKDAGIVDVFWAFGMALAGAYYAYKGIAPEWLRLTLAVLVVVWFSRLGFFIFYRGIHQGEDGRYEAMRVWLGDRSGLGFFVFFQMQAGFIILLSLPLFAIANTPEPNPTMVALGVGIALLAFVGEATADHQLKEFRANPANKGLTCRKGWWKFSRHPNYFFEWLHWFAYPLMGFNGPYGHWLWFAPLVMFLFLIFFTGIPFAEQQALRSRGENYKDYQQQTSMFFPWPPSK